MKLKKYLTYFIIISTLILSSCGKKSDVEEPTEIKQETTETTTTEQTTTEELTTEEPMIENPIDFTSLWEQDKNVYAYIVIPDTNISYPILQSDEEQPEDYYLDHNLDGSSGYPGCIYTQRLNSEDFDDYNTVIYGHNMRNGDGFHDLHQFREEEFFNQNEYIYIYTPEYMLTYQIFGAYVFTDVLILAAYDFETEEGYQDYLDMIKDYGNGNYRDVDTLTTDDRIITLSTCTNYDPERYLVQAKLVDKIKTYTK